MIRIYKIILAVLVLSFIIVPVSATTEQEVIDFFLYTYNPQIDALGKIPGFTTLFGEQVMHIIIKDKAGGTTQFELGAVTNSNGLITEINSGIPINPTLKLITDSETIDLIKQSDDPEQYIKDSIGSKIIIEGVDIGGSIRVTIMNIGLFFAKLFGLV